MELFSRSCWAGMEMGPKTDRARSGQGLVRSGQVWLGVGAFYFPSAGERIPFRPHVFYNLLEKRQKPEQFQLVVRSSCLLGGRWDVCTEESREKEELIPLGTFLQLCYMQCCSSSDLTCPIGLF